MKIIYTLLAIGAICLLPVLVAADCGVSTHTEAAAVSDTTAAISDKPMDHADTVAMTDDNIPKKLMISLTDEGIIGTPAEADGGLYVVTIVNNSSAPRGVVLNGIDLCCSPYVRYSKVLEPGHQETFRWYFPEDKNVKIRDLLSCTHEQRTCMVASTGSLNSTINFF